MKAPDDLYYLVYTSRESFKLYRRDLRQILDQAAHFNAQHNITGMLIYRQGSFLQVLEGSEQAITDLYKSICTDPRHQQIQLVIAEPAKQRYFSEWSMGFCDLANQQDKELSAYTTFLHHGLCATLRPDSPSIPASLLTMFVYDFSERTTALH